MWSASFYLCVFVGTASFSGFLALFDVADDISDVGPYCENSEFQILLVISTNLEASPYQQVSTPHL